jgi:hypothetical protein
VKWPSGKKDLLKDLAADFIYTIVEGDGVKQKEPFTGSSSANLSNAKPDPLK